MDYVIGVKREWCLHSAFNYCPLLLLYIHTYSYRTVSHLLYFHIAALSIASRRKSTKADPAETGTTPSRYGEMLFTALAKKLRMTLSLSVQVFYHDHSSATFVVTKRLQRLISAVKSKYAAANRVVEQSMSCGYKTKAITLTFPDPPKEGGWCVWPAVQPAQIETKLIREYREGKTPPNIHLSMKWTGEGVPVEEKVKIAVGGTSVESFFLLCRPACASDSSLAALLLSPQSQSAPFSPISPQLSLTSSDTPHQSQTPTSLHTPPTQQTGTPHQSHTTTSLHTPFTYHTDTPRQFQTPTSLHTPFTYHTDTPRHSQAPTSPHTPFTDAPRQSHAPTSLHTPFIHDRQSHAPTSLHTPFTYHTDTPRQSHAPTSLHTHHTDTPHQFQTPTSLHTPFTYHTDTPRHSHAPTSPHTPFTRHIDAPRQSHAPTSLHTPFIYDTDTPRQSHAPTSLHTPFTYHTDTLRQCHAPTSLHTQHTDTPHQFQTPTSLHIPPTQHTGTPHQSNTPTSLHTPPTQHTGTPHQSQTPTSPPNQPSLGVSVPPRSPVQSGTKSVELIALQRSSNVFCGGVDPNTLATKLRAKDLLTREEYKRATQTAAVDDQRNNDILKALERRVSADSRVFHTVVSLLQEEPALKAVGDKMQGEF